jgi:hypothetical protein
MKGTASRERVRTALNRREPDRVPVDLGGRQSGISHETCVPLKALPEVEPETRMDEGVQRLARVDETVLRSFGVDIQRVLPFKTPGDASENVKREIDALAPGGGYILASCHNIHANAPPRNVVAMFEAAGKHGAYPIRSTA